MTTPRAARHPALTVMLLLTFATGVLDAATYLGLHRVFTANMTGNVIFVGLALAGFADVPLLRPALALAGFVLGAAVVGGCGRGRAVGSHRDRVAAWTLLVVAAVVAATAVLLAVVPEPAAGVLDAVTVLLAAAMGGQAVAARRVGVPDVTTVVVTSTLVMLASEQHLTGRGGDGAATRRRLAAVGAMFLGALVGALLLRWHLAAAVGACAVLVAVVAGVGLARSRRP